MSIYAQRYGMRPVINAAGNYTALGGSIMDPTVTAAMQQAAADWVSLPDLQRLVAEEVGNLLGFTSGSGSAVQITAGAAAANMLAAAAAIAQGSVAAMGQLPDPGDRPCEIVFPAQMGGVWTKTFAMAGAGIVIAPTEPIFDPALNGRVLASSLDSVASAVTDATCAIGAVLTWEMPAQGLISVAALGSLAARFGLPLLVDAAAEIPPIGRIEELRAAGATTVSVSGGKAIGGPNATGMLVGSTPYVRSAGMMAAPQEGMLGRVAKVAREQLVGLHVAVEQYLQSDEAEMLSAWERRCDEVTDSVGDVAGMRIERVCPDETGLPVPRLRIHLGPQSGTDPVEKITNELRTGEFDVRLRGGYPGARFLNVDVACLRRGEAAIVGRRLREEILAAS